MSYSVSQHKNRKLVTTTQASNAFSGVSKGGNTNKKETIKNGNGLVVTV
jgi:hypothetical protein